MVRVRERFVVDEKKAAVHLGETVFQGHAAIRLGAQPGQMLIAREQPPQAARIKAGLAVQQHLAGRSRGCMLRYLDEFVIGLLVERQHLDIFITEINALGDPRDMDAGGLAKLPRRFPEIKPAWFGVKIISRLHE